MGGILLGGTDLLENIMAGNIDLNTHADIYRQLGNENFRQTADWRSVQKVVEILDNAIEVVNQEHNNCLASVNSGEKRR